MQYSAVLDSSPSLPLKSACCSCHSLDTTWGWGIQAAAMASGKVPEVNASWRDTVIRQFKTVHVSVAVQAPSGLMVPVIRSAQHKGLAQISAEVKKLAARVHEHYVVPVVQMRRPTHEAFGLQAKDGKLKPDDMQGGTITISNLGMFGVKSFAAIINPPQVWRC